ncbi:alpha-L-glutamate ligase [Streptomyces albus subsp. albus]|nr:alpha-L-glutamate ligase [Streptomyces albus subsp. albus]
MTVLVLTRPTDSTADLVIAELSDRGVPVHRLDPAEFPESLATSARIGPGLRDWWGHLHGQHRGLSLTEVRSVYYRRPGRYRLHPEMPEEDARWAASEARSGFGGLLAALPCRWVNHPYRNKVAGVAPVALATAARCGLRIPETIVTNDPTEARRFISTLPGKVAAYKALGTAAPSDDHDGRPRALWTTQVRADEVDDSVARTAHQFQEWVDKQYEVRMTAVGDHLFASEIHAGSKASRIDFRTDYDSLTYKTCDVPDDVAGGVRGLMAAFDLRYVALDFLVNQRGHWYLIDVNPGGQWAFIPDLRGPISRALADLLEGTSCDH